MTWQLALKLITGLQLEDNIFGAEAADQFTKQMDAMMQNGRQWMKANPDAKIEVHWPRVHVIADVETALKGKYLVANAPGLALIKALWPVEQVDAPTLSMVTACLYALLPDRKERR